MERSSLAINLADGTLYSMDLAGDIIPLGNTTNWTPILEAHFNARNPHGVWDKEVVVSTGDVTVDGTFDEVVVKRIGTGNGTVTLQTANIAIGSLIYIDNVRNGSGTVTITADGAGTITFDGGAPEATKTLTGKGQLELVKSGADTFEITNIVT
jgi:hypothetical protein